jgi:hypothetical protein
MNKLKIASIFFLPAFLLAGFFIVDPPVTYGESRVYTQPEASKELSRSVIIRNLDDAKQLNSQPEPENEMANKEMLAKPDLDSPIFEDLNKEMRAREEGDRTANHHTKPEPLRPFDKK